MAGDERKGSMKNGTDSFQVQLVCGCQDLAEHSTVGQYFSKTKFLSKST